MLEVRVTVPPGIADDVHQHLGARPEVTNLVRVGAGAGDVLVFEVPHDAARVTIRELQRLGVPRTGAVVMREALPGGAAPVAADAPAIDVQGTLGPAGFAARTQLNPPGPEQPLWTVTVELPPVPGLVPDLTPASARYVGACGHTRADALIRGAGEAVERYGMHPRPGLEVTTTEDAVPRLDPRPAHVTLADPATPGPVLAGLPHVRAVHLRNGSPVLVPAPLVDWPPPDPAAAWFDPSPSGAAAGSTPDMALRSALLETIERDAFTVAWERGLRLPTITDPDAAAPGDPADPGEVRARETLARLWRLTGSAGLRPVLARVPVVAGLWCVVATLVDADPAGRCSVGLKVSDRPWAALLGAFQEAWQLHAAMAGFADGPALTREQVVTEEDRVRYLTTPAGIADTRDWVAGFLPATPGSPWPAPSPVPTDDLVAAVVADGGDPLLVDLTPRLPAALRAMGWRSVKVVPVGYQALRMDESRRWTFHRDRLATAPDRTGCEARYPAGTGRVHPLP